MPDEIEITKQELADLEKVSETTREPPREGLTESVVHELERNPAFSELIDIAKQLARR